MTRKIILPAALLTLSLSSLLAAQTGKRLWVLEAPGRMVEYAPATFAPRQSVKLPSDVLRHPENLAVNGHGQMLFVPAQVEVLPSTFPAAKLWLWDGQTAAILDRGVLRKSSAAGANLSRVEAVPQATLSADGTHLFWFVNRYSIVQQKQSDDPDSIHDASVHTTFRAWQTDLRGGNPAEIATLSFPSCECTTSVCSESCPEAAVWFPDEGVSDFFLVTHWIPGQIGSDYQASFLYQRSAGSWSARKLPAVLEQVLDAAQGGETILYALPDAGCCGWINESNDQTLLLRDGKTSVLFDEFARYQNRDYDLNFYTPAARLSPGRNAVALQIAADMYTGGEIRLSSDGKPNDAELTRIRQALPDLPAVEVVRPADPGKPLARLPHATLVGWLNDQEVLVIEDGALAAFHVATGSRRRSTIKVTKASYVFLR